MIFFKVDTTTLSSGLCRLQDMCAKAHTFEELDKIRSYQNLVIAQTKVHLDLVSWRAAIKCFTDATDRIFSESVAKIRSTECF